jgi:hypothetical protein
MNNDAVLAFINVKATNITLLQVCGKFSTLSLQIKIALQSGYTAVPGGAQIPLMNFKSKNVPQAMSATGFPNTLNYSLDFRAQSLFLIIAPTITTQGNVTTTTTATTTSSKGGGLDSNAATIIIICVVVIIVPVLIITLVIILWIKHKKFCCFRPRRIADTGMVKMDAIPETRTK